MFWLMTALLLTAMLMLPLRLQADIHRGQRRLMRLQFTLAGLRRQWLIESQSTPAGRQVTLTGSPGHTRQIRPSGQQRQTLRSLRRTLQSHPALRRFLLDHLHPEQLDAQLLLHTGSAASTALLTGALQTLVRAVPSRWVRMARVRILPDFLREYSTFQARCIFTVRLGILLITAGLLLAIRAAQAMNREGHTLWNTPSEN